MVDSAALLLLSPSSYVQNLRPPCARKCSSSVPRTRPAAAFSTAARPWRQDVCRHSFASYHAAKYRNLHELQLQMGHRDSTLLRTRYLVVPAARTAKRFWG